MKIGTHNLESAMPRMTIVRVRAEGITLRQSAGQGQAIQEITLSADQIALLKDVLA